MGKGGPERERKLLKVTQQAHPRVGLPWVSWFLGGPSYPRVKTMLDGF